MDFFTKSISSLYKRLRFLISAACFLNRSPRTPHTILAAALLLLMSSCARQSAQQKPNVLWIVWDTVRADHLSLYGHSKPTTPFLEKWAEDARVFTNCLSVAPTTSPAHASMFTGLMPTEHTTSNTDTFLPDTCMTLAEILKKHGYRTFLYSANPHISSRCNFTQGFEVSEHPWNEKNRFRALEIVRTKVQAYDRSSTLFTQLQKNAISQWAIKSSGKLALQVLEDWLSRAPESRPYFAFLNYMEAHHPCIPEKKYRKRIMGDSVVRLSYQVDRSYQKRWLYTFGLKDYTADQLSAIAATYDAAIAELDDLFQTLITRLKKKGFLKNTVVILTADHGEHLGEHHMLDHQYSVYNPLLKVPLVLHYPEHITAGRMDAPVMNIDLFPTILELAGIKKPPLPSPRAINLLTPEKTRLRIAEYPVVLKPPILRIKKLIDDWNPAPWVRALRGATLGSYKYIWSSDGRHELFNLDTDPYETNNIISVEAHKAAEIQKQLHDSVSTFRATPHRRSKSKKVLKKPVEKYLKALGYL